MSNIKKKRHPILSACLSLIVPGLGQLYNGSVKRAVYFYLWGSVFLLFSYFTLFNWFYGFVVFIAGLILFKIYSALDAFLNSRKSDHMELKQSNKWYIYFVVIIIHLFVVFPTHYFILSPIRPYRIPSESMEPNLLEGDIFFIHKHYYSFFKPNREDIIVFQSPYNSSINFVKRIIGLPNEIIRIRHNNVYINDQIILEPYLRKNYSSSRYLLKVFHSVKIPDDSYFVLGDNRNQSMDSRHFKAIGKTHIKGKALYIIWAKDKHRIGSTL